MEHAVSPTRPMVSKGYETRLQLKPRDGVSLSTKIKEKKDRWHFLYSTVSASCTAGIVDVFSVSKLQLFGGL